VSSRGIRALGQHHVRVGPSIPRSDHHVWAPALVGDGNYSFERVVRGGDYLCEQVVGKYSCESESSRARPKVVVRAAW
jgi:hypothetical protein